MINRTSQFHTISRQFRPFDVADISEVNADQQRDWKRRGFFDARTGNVMEVARFLFVRTLRDAGFDLAQAWALATDEIIGWVVFHAGQLPGALDDSGAEKILTKNPSYRLKAAMELTGRRTVAAGPLLAWGPALKAGLFKTFDLARSEVDQKALGPHLIHVLDLSELPNILIERAGVIGYIQRAA